MNLPPELNSDQLLSSDIFQRYLKYIGQNLTDGVKVNDIYKSHLRDISIVEFQVARSIYCQKKHGCMSLCKTCLPLVEAAKLVESNGVIPLKHLFCSQFQSKGYKSDKVISRFMQLPIAILKVKGTLHVLEYSSNIEYERLQELIDKLIPEQKLALGLNREALQALCNLASTEADRKLIRVATTAGMSASQAETTYGISNLHKEREKVAQAIKEYTAIRSAVDELVRAKEKAVLESFGVTEASDSEEEIVDSDSDDAFMDNEKKTAGTERSGIESIEADTCECDGFIQIDRDVV